jgi:hypothetical protein
MRIAVLSERNELVAGFADEDDGVLRLVACGATCTSILKCICGGGEALNVFMVDQLIKELAALDVPDHLAGVRAQLHELAVTAAADVSRTMRFYS